MRVYLQPYRMRKRGRGRYEMIAQIRAHKAAQPQNRAGRIMPRANTQPISLVIGISPAVASVGRPVKNVSLLVISSKTQHGNRAHPPTPNHPEGFPVPEECTFIPLIRCMSQGPCRTDDDEGL